MRKILLFCLMLTGMLSVSAQTEETFLSKVTFRPTIGLNISKEAGDGASSDALVSFKAGAIADYAYKEDWGFRSGLLLSGKGGKYGEDVNGGMVSWSMKATDSPWYLEIPLDVYYQYRLNDITFKGFTGFPLEIGLFGNYKIEDGGKGNGHVGDQKRSAFDDLSRFGIAWNIGVEAEWKKISLGIEFSRHLTNDAKEGTCHMQVFSINVGYTL